MTTVKTNTPSIPSKLFCFILGSILVACGVVEFNVLHLLSPLDQVNDLNTAFMVFGRALFGFVIGVGALVAIFGHRLLRL